jgi:hypothetical protein
MVLRELKTIPIVVICRDRLAPLRQLLDWLNRAGYNRPILVDNASTFPPLVDFLESVDIEVVRMDSNVGHLVPWTPEVQARLDPHQPFVVTDCDVVPDDGCPADVVEHMAELLIDHAHIEKVGLGLRIDDLPDSYALKQQVIAWESRFWEGEVAPGVFEAEVDTTFALYRSPATPYRTAPALRTGPPYVARHLTWYIDSANLTAEQQYYREHADPSVTHWDADSTSESLQRLLQARAAERNMREAVEQSANPLLASWLTEPPLVDESQYTPWAETGWLAWNAMSPELAFCDFAGALMRLLRPELVVETGVGQGFVTRRLAAHLGPDQRLLAFEEDSVIRQDLSGLPIFADANRSIGSTGSPTNADLAHADFTVLDSEIPFRLEELDRWIASAPAGAVLLVHDGGNGHGPETPHHLIRSQIEERELDGAFLSNPRGAFLGIKPDRRVALRAAEAKTSYELKQALEQATSSQRELDRLREMHAYRVVRLELFLRNSPAARAAVRLVRSRKRDFTSRR